MRDVSLSPSITCKLLDGKSAELEFADQHETLWCIACQFTGQQSIDGLTLYGILGSLRIGMWNRHSTALKALIANDVGRHNHNQIDSTIRISLSLSPEG